MFNKIPSANITTKNIYEELIYDCKIMITVQSEYPFILPSPGFFAERRINARISNQVNTFLFHAKTVLFRQAIKDYHFALENGFPFRQYEAVLNYTVTYNENCYLSTYHDNYQYLGGAHGITLRTSDTWNLISGRVIQLSSFFPNDKNYKIKLIKKIIAQAENNYQENPGIYFDNYKSLICKGFSEENFYLTPSGLALYFGHYVIAPYSTGIVVFIIPYDEVGWLPSCPMS